MSGASTLSYPKCARIRFAGPLTPAAGAVFLVLYAAAGSLLPLALAHRWGRIRPRWVLPLAGRDVPRWIVLVPAFMMGGGRTAYFGLVGGTYIVLGEFGFPLWWTLAVIPRYTLWGIGLLVAAAFYRGATEPPCHAAA